MFRRFPKVNFSRIFSARSLSLNLFNAKSIQDKSGKGERMRHVSSVNQQPRRSFRFLLQYFKWAAASTVICLATSAAAFQSSPAVTAKRPASAHKTQPSVPQKKAPQEKP